MNVIYMLIDILFLNNQISMRLVIVDKRLVFALKCINARYKAKTELERSYPNFPLV